MKKLIVLFVLLSLILTKGYTQENNHKPELRLSFISSVAGPIDQTIELRKFGASRTSLISGYDLKMIVPTKRENLQWLIGTFYQEGEESNSKTLVGALYFGPQLSTRFKYVNFTGYISAGIFNVSDEIFALEQNTVLYNSVSNYTAPGTKSGLGLSLHFKGMSLNGGYQIFMTAAKNNTIAYHGLEVGFGIKF